MRERSMAHDESLVFTELPLLDNQLARVGSKGAPSTEQVSSGAAAHVAIHAVSQELIGATVSTDVPLMQAGLDSLGATEFRSRLSERLGGVDLPATLIFDFSTLRQIEAHLIETDPLSDLVPDLRASRSDEGRLRVSIDGSSALLPSGASSLRSSSCTLMCGCDAIVQVPVARWDVCAQPVSPPPIASRVRHMGLVPDAELADNAAFAISAAEVAAMDPCQRLLLELGYASLHTAGMTRTKLGGSLTGVFLGFSGAEFAQVLAASPAGGSVYAATGSSSSIASGRLSYVLGLHGPCASYDTACSAALVAGHAGLRALQLSECATGLVVAASLILVPSAGTSYAVAGMTSPRGRSHTFDNRADGYARGEACSGIALRVVLGCIAKAAELLLAGSAVRQDGLSASLTAPNGQAQQGLLVAALVDAVSSIDELALQEAHGTGTALGDPIEMGSLVAVIVAARETPLPLGGVKANIGHAEPAAGMTGLIKLTFGLWLGKAAPNAQLRVLNALLKSTRRALEATLSTQSPGTIERHSKAAGVSSFGYSGTIAHTVLHHSDAEEESALCTVQRLLLTCARRRAFLWVEPNVSANTHREGTRTSIYATCWSSIPRPQPPLPRPWLLVADGEATASPSSMAMVSCQTKAILLGGGASYAPSQHGTHLALMLAQQLTSHVGVCDLLVLTCGVLAFGTADAPSATAHGGACGLGRVLRLEHPALRAQSADICSRGTCSVPLPGPTQELEAAWSGTTCFAARLRASTATVTHQQASARGIYGITGGLGGLGIRAAALLIEDSASAVLLASRNGRVARDGQGLEAQLRAMHTVAQVVVCDGAEAQDASVLHSVCNLSGLLHVAGLVDKGLLVKSDARRLQWMHASKAAGAWHLHCASAIVPLASRMLFSSVGAGLGNTGQGNYAVANACLDAHARSRRAHGVVACSMQWPLVGGAGMGATVFAAMSERQVTMTGMAGISLEEYGSCLSAQLMPPINATLSSQMAHISDVPSFLKDLADSAQPRFSELFAQIKHPPVGIRPVVPTTSTASVSRLEQSYTHLKPSQRRVTIETMVLRVVRELTGTSVPLTAETPLMDAGVDSLAATELASRLQTHLSVGLSATIVFEQPTPRAVAAHVLEQFTSEVGTAPALADEQYAGVLHKSMAMVDRRLGGCDGDTACGDAFGGVPRKLWGLEEAVDTRMLSTIALDKQPFNVVAFGLSPAKLGSIEQKKRLLLEHVLPGNDRPVWASAERSLISALRGHLTFAHKAAHGAILATRSHTQAQLSSSYGTALVHKVQSCRRAFAWPPWRFVFQVDLLHPFAQLRQPTSDDTYLFRSIAALFSCLIDHHVLQERIIFPGAGYLEIGRAAADASDAASALRSVYFLQPLAMETAGLLVDCALADGRFEVRSSANEAFADATVHCSGSLTTHSRWQSLNHASIYSGACGGPSDVAALYDGFASVCLQYGPGYRTLMQAWASSGLAVAQLGARVTRERTKVHPADLDDALCAGALIPSSYETGETRLPFAVDEAQLQGARGALWAVRCSWPFRTGQVTNFLCSLYYARAPAGCGTNCGWGPIGASGRACKAATSPARRLQVACAAIRGSCAASATPPVHH